jgi:TATA-box binding protein (TBP) (component of TFIID and TFIIIB)
LLFESGSVTIIGATCLCEAEIVAKAVEEHLNDISVECKLCTIKQHNLVVSAKLDNQIVRKLWNIVDLGAKGVLRDSCMLRNVRVEFEPELYPSINFHIKEPKATVCVFRKGSANITGIVSSDVVDNVIEIIESLF